MAEFESLRGKLLVAEPTMQDPNFARSVVLLLEHTEEGAIGVVLNRPSDLDVVDALPEWTAHAAVPRVVFIGGPVATSAGVCLARMQADAPVDGWEPIVGPVGILDLSREPEEFGRAIDAVRIFVGHAGWVEGQLEGEIEEGAWFILDPATEDVLTSEPNSQWRQVLRRQGGTLAMVAQFPLDVSMN